MARAISSSSPAISTTRSSTRPPSRWCTCCSRFFRPISPGRRSFRSSTTRLPNAAGGAAPSSRKKVRPALGGEPAAANPVRGRGGWGRDRAAKLLWLLSVSARRGGGDRRARVADGDPLVRIRLRLTLDEAIVRLRPRQNFLDLIVEHELALIGLHRQHGVAVALAVAYHRDEQRFARPARFHQRAA